MIFDKDLPQTNSPSSKRRPRQVRIAVMAVVICAVSLGAVPRFTAPAVPAGASGAYVIYPVGTVDISEPSGQAPPGPSALRGYRLFYQNDFNGTSLSPGWYVFSGVPGGDPGGQFDAAHVVVGGGLLLLNTWKDSKYQNRWVTGGLCQCGLSHTYGAYFVRSRVTGTGPNAAELLWPVGKIWPPEIDFNENGGRIAHTTSSVHFGSTNHIDNLKLKINMMQWHTWGVIWTPTSVTYVVDGRVWGEVSAPLEIPRRPMTLDFEQRTLCSLGKECPSVPVAMKVDWVAEYTAK